MHPAKLTDSPTKVELKIYYDQSTYFAEKLYQWITRVKPRKIGSYIKTHNAEKNYMMRDISFENAQYVGMNRRGWFNDDEPCYLTLYLDWVLIEWVPDKDKSNSAIFFLNNTGFKVTSEFYGLLLPREDSFTIGRRKDDYYPVGESTYRFEYGFQVKDSASSTIAEIEKIPYINFLNIDTIEQAIEYADAVCIASSFFHLSSLDYLFAKIYLNHKKVSIRKVLTSQKDEHLGNLWHLKYYDTLEKYLKSNCLKNFLTDRKVIGKCISNYLQSYQVAGSAKFLLLYNIIEIAMSKQSEENLTFKEIIPVKESNAKYQEALQSLLRTIQAEEQSDFIDKWNGVIKKLKYKPAKSGLNKFLTNNKLNPNTFPISVSKLKSIRDSLTHGSVESVKPDDLEGSIVLLKRITGILILNKLGITNWELDSNLLS